MLEQLDLIGKTSEMARLFGIQFLHVLTRGSQVEIFLIHYINEILILNLFEIIRFLKLCIYYQNLSN